MLNNFNVQQTKIKCPFTNSEVIIASYAKGFSEILCCFAQKDCYGKAECFKQDGKFCGYGSWGGNCRAR